MRVLLAQIKAVIGDFDGNRKKIQAIAMRAATPREERSFATRGGPSTPPPAEQGRGALLVFPELALCGCPPLDLLERPCFVAACEDSLRKLQRELPPGLAVALGSIGRGAGGKLVNAIYVFKNGELVFSQAKTPVSRGGVFDETRYFEPDAERRLFELEDKRIAFVFGGDASDPLGNAELCVMPAASPFVAGGLASRVEAARKARGPGAMPLLYCNHVGANDLAVFDGRSFALDAAGGLAAMAGWDEELLVLDTDELDRADPGKRLAAPASDSEARYEEIEKALVIGIRDYIRGCGFSKACLGLSGGMDSALVAYLAAQAIGPDKLSCIAMPSRFSSEGSIKDSEELCARLGLRLETIPIEGPFKAYLDLLEPRFEGRPFDLTEENLQARIRGCILMAWSNKFGSLLLCTGNKSELAVGYCTLYGDMCGALAPLGDLFKTEVFGLARAINARAAAELGREPIPRAIIDKPPSAELRPDQKDQDSLPPYETLDRILTLHIMENLGTDEIAALGHDRDLTAKLLGMVARTEYKRGQAAPVIRVSARAFGAGRRIPLVRALDWRG